MSETEENSVPHVELQMITEREGLNESDEDEDHS